MVELDKMIAIMKTLIILAITAQFAQAGLLRKPKVYNALITTDQNITPSRAIPVIQPHLQETYAAYPSYSFGNHFGIYDGYQFGYNGRSNYPFIGHGAIPEERNFFHHRGFASDAEVHSNTDNTIISSPPPFYGYNPINLAPYPYSSQYPLVYDQLGGFGPNPYLPPFGYYPNGFGSIAGTDVSKVPENGVVGLGGSGGSGVVGLGGAGGSVGGSDSSGSNGGGSGSGGGGGSGGSSGSGGGSSGGGSSGGSSSGGGGGGGASSGSSSSVTSSKTSRSRKFDMPSQQPAQTLDESIKNYANKNPSIPDVPPPPLPSGAKTTDN